MDGSLDEEIVFVVKRLAKAVSKHGVKKVVAVLDQLNNEESFIEAHKSLIKYVFKESSKAFQVSTEDLKRKNIRGLAVEARAMSFILLKKHLDLKHADIAALVGSRNHSIVSNAIRNFNELNYDVKTDRRFIDTFRNIDTKVQSHRDILWLKHGYND